MWSPIETDDFDVMGDFARFAEDGRKGRSRQQPARVDERRKLLDGGELVRRNLVASVAKQRAQQPGRISRRRHLHRWAREYPSASGVRLRYRDPRRLARADLYGHWISARRHADEVFGQASMVRRTALNGR